MKKILFDTNFLVIPFQFSLDIFDEFERIISKEFSLFTLDKCLEEAIWIENGKYKEMVEKLIEQNDIEVIETETNLSADSSLVKHAEKGFIVATNDRELRKELKLKDNPVIILRGEKKLQLERP